MSSSPARQRIVLWCVLTCQLMVVLDATVVNIALPDIKSSLHISTANLSWTINAYTLTFGGLLLLGARMGDILGHRVTFNGGIALFTLASLIGGASQNTGELLGARAIQGVGAAMASPAALAILTTMYADGRARTKAVGYYTAVSIGGGAIGLILGGALTQLASWRWVLLINVPIGIVVLAAAARVISPRERRPGALDVPGAVTSTLGMSSVTFAFVNAAQHGWGSVTTLVSFAAGGALLAGFVMIERTASSPITPLRLFAHRNRSTAYLSRFLLVASMQGMLFFLSQFMQEVLGYSPLACGLAFFPLTVCVFAASQLSSRIWIERYGSRRVVAAGLALSTAGLAWLHFVSPGSGYLAILGPLILLGLGNGAAFVPLTTIALSDVAPEDAGAGAGLVNAVQQVGGAVGLAVLVTVAGTTSRHYLSGSHPGLSVGQLADQAFTHGAGAAFLTGALLLGSTLLICVALLRTPTRDPGVVLPLSADLPAGVGAE